jgi:hypothetical protein
LPETPPLAVEAVDMFYMLSSARSYSMGMGGAMPDSIKLSEIEAVQKVYNIDSVDRKLFNIRIILAMDSQWLHWRLKFIESQRK